MNTRFTFILLFVISISIAACGGSSKQFIKTDYINGNGNGPGSLSVLKINFEDFGSDFSEHDFGRLQTTEKSVFQNSIITFFTPSSNSEHKGELNRADLKNSEFEVRNFSEEGTSISVIAPVQGAVLGNDYVNTRYVVIFDQFRFRQYMSDRESQYYGGGAPNPIVYVNFETKYVIWDNEIGDAIGWGTVDADRRVETTRMVEIYNELLEESLQKMVRKSPFRT